MTNYQKNARKRSIQAKTKKQDDIVEVEGGEEESTDSEESKELVVKKDEEDPMAQANKSMSMIMPIMAVSISFIAPLGLALYWLMSNILMIVERIFIDKFMFQKEENA